MTDESNSEDENGKGDSNAPTIEQYLAHRRQKAQVRMRMTKIPGMRESGLSMLARVEKEEEYLKEHGREAAVELFRSNGINVV